MSLATLANVDVPCVPIGERLVGPGQPVYVIAEAGVNHDGLLSRALQLVDVAADARADAVKFQVFRANELAAASATTAVYQRQSGGHSQHAMLARLELSDDEFQRIRSHCDERRLEFLATPFGTRDVDRLCELGVRAIKIASTDLNNVPLLHKGVQTGLPLVVSTGAATVEEIHESVSRLQQWGAAGRLILLHCVSGYPTPLEAANLAAIGTLQRTFGITSGFSDHTTFTQTGALAVATGASLLEKHFTLDRAAIGPDHSFSLHPSELREYISAVRVVERALGTGQLGMTAIEADVRAVARRSIVAACNLTGGTVLQPDMLAVKRPAGGIGPERIDELIGRQIATDVPRDTLLTWDMVR